MGSQQLPRPAAPGFARCRRRRRGLEPHHPKCTLKYGPALSGGAFLRATAQLRRAHLDGPSYRLPAHSSLIPKATLYFAKQLAWNTLKGCARVMYRLHLSLRQLNG
eukprot:359087-Chlamydomonas_euryale.AAC.1